MKRVFQKNLVLMFVLALGLNSFAQGGNVYANGENVAINGYDVVNYFTNYTSEKGTKEFNTTYDGSTFYFKNVEHLKLFKESPEKYMPEYGGYCAFAMAEKNAKVYCEPSTFKIRDGKLYLFFNDDYEGKKVNTIIYWNQNEEEAVKKADANWKNLKSKNNIMNLTKELSDFAEQMSKQAPPEVLQTMGEEIGKLAQSGIIEKAKSKGDKAPYFTLENSDGKQISLSNLLEKGSVVLSFNRGNWCPFCNLEFKALQESISAIKNTGANLVVISPQLPIMSRELKQKNGFEYDILYDKGNEVAKQFGISFALPEPLRPIHDAFGMDIPAHNGNTSFELPLATTYVINKDGNITYSYINANWMKRAEPNEVIAEIN